jgi:hypothetical protein
MKNEFPLSASLRSSINRFSPQERITAWALVSEILSAHPEYADHMGGKLRGAEGPSQGELRTTAEWLDGLTSLFNMERVEKEVEVLDGRLAIWGLAQLDPPLKSYLDPSGFLSMLADEYKREKKIPPGELVQPSVRADLIFPPAEEIHGGEADSLARIRVIRDDREKANALKEMMFNARDQTASRTALDVMEIAREIEDPAARADTLIGILPYLPNEIRSSVAREALESARQVEDSYSKVLALMEVFPYLPEEIRPDVAREAENATQEIEDPAARKDAVAFISKHLSRKPEERPQKTRKTQPRRVKSASAYFPPIAGYISDRPDQEAADLLDIEREVTNIANVLTFKQVQPPLALGLFGDWGSGKTFFMGKLRRYVNRIAGYYQREEQTTKAEAKWCSRVAQIDFNAWHFSDSNLWASLVTRIYEGLDRELNEEKPIADDIKKKMIEAQVREAEAKSRLDLAKTSMDSAQENLTTKRKEREEKENTLQGLIGSLPELLDKSSLKEPLQKAARLLGMPEAAESYEALEALDGELKSLSGQFKASTARLLNAPWALLGMAVMILILPLLLTLAIEQWGSLLSDVGKRVAEISSFILFLAGWLQVQARRGLQLVATVDKALAEASDIRKQRIEECEEVRNAQRALTDAQAEEQAAQTNLETARTDLQRLQVELQELRPERKLQRLIESRASSGAYAQHLGIISLIRSDFEAMSGILAEMVNEREDFSKAPPIQRIILYIDDLDRCRPERVVEVLEAIHLLLYFPLFIVVVAVDPRWLRHSLTQHYPATLREGGGRLLTEKDPLSALFSTPQDYLEKIFQIPFALRPVEKGGYQNLVNDLLKPLPAREKQRGLRTPATPSTPGDGPPAAEGRQPEAGTDQGRQKPPEQKMPPVEKEKIIEEETFAPIPPRQLDFTPWEQEAIQQLWPMFRTPRTVKRFINIYRLLRAGLSSDREVKSFEGTLNKPGEYQVVLLLLAAITAFPNGSTQLLFRLDRWLDTQESKNRRSAVSWKEVLGSLRKEAQAAHVRARTGAGQTSRQVGIGNQGRGGADVYQGGENDWDLMMDCLDRLSQGGRMSKSIKLTTLRTWTMRVARFSFSVQPT